MMPVAPVVLPIAGGRNSGPRRPGIRLTQQIFEANPNGSFGAEPEAADLHMSFRSAPEAPSIRGVS